jgi:thioredoxin 1
MIIIEDDKLNNLLDETCFLLFYFTAHWCGPCQKIKPLLEEISNRVDNNILKVCKIDVDNNSELSEQYEITSIPTLILIKEKNIIDKYSGSNKEKIAELFKKIVS